MTGWRGQYELTPPAAYSNMTTAQLSNAAIGNPMSVNPRRCFGTLFVGTLVECNECRAKPVCADCNQDTQAEALDVLIEGWLYAASNPQKANVPYAEYTERASKSPKRPTSTPPKNIIHDTGIQVTIGELLASREYQQRALAVPWPDVFFMEEGKDRRGITPVDDRERRHQIDWYRSGSCVEPMPVFTEFRAKNNPYTNQAGIGGAIAYHTFEVAKTMKEPFEYTDIFDAVVARSNMAASTYNKMCVKDSLRDMALFGIATRWRKGRAMLFSIAS